MIFHDWILPPWVLPKEVNRTELLSECRLALAYYQLKLVDHNPFFGLCGLTRSRRWSRLRVCVKASLSKPNYSLEYNMGITLDTREKQITIRLNWLRQLEELLLLI